MQIAYLTTDEVNEHLATELADCCGATLCPLSPVDIPAKGQYDAVLCDWDFLPGPQRQRLLQQLLRTPRGPFLAVHSYNMTGKEARALRRRHVAVYPRLRPSLFIRLAQSVKGCVGKLRWNGTSGRTGARHRVGRARLPVRIAG